MSIAATIDPVALQAIVSRIALFFLAAGGGMETARQAALATLAAHDPANEDELALAGEVVQFSMLTFDAAGQCLALDLSDAALPAARTAAIRLHKQGLAARRALDRLRQTAKPVAAEGPAAATEPDEAPGAEAPTVEALVTAALAAEALAAEALSGTCGTQARRPEPPGTRPAPAGHPKAAAPRHQMTKAEMLARMHESSLRAQAAAAAVAPPPPHVCVSA